MFDYKQRPWSRAVTDEEYDRATGRDLLKTERPAPLRESTSDASTSEDSLGGIVTAPANPYVFGESSGIH